MKIALTLLTLTTLFTGCVDKNGFDNFNFSQERQQWENNQINSKIQDQTQTQGIISAVYLNKVMPELYKGAEYFYVTVYLKNDSEQLSFTLNDQPSTLQEELTNNDNFKAFTNGAKQWNKYYIIGFLEQKGQDVLTLEAKNCNISSSKMVFKKDE